MSERYFYTGVGSRRAPPEVLGKIEEIARYLAGKGFWLRSGGAEGCDKAFERGAGAMAVVYTASHVADIPAADKARILQIYLKESLEPAHLQAILANPRYVDIHVRNVCQVLGHGDERWLSKAVILWAEPIDNGARVHGGTNTAYQVARYHRVPIVNLWHGVDDAFDRAREALEHKR